MSRPPLLAAARQRIVSVLQRLGLDQVVLSARNEVRRGWYVASDRIRCALLAQRTAQVRDASVMVTTRVRRDGTRRAVLARVRQDHRASATVARNRDVVRAILRAEHIPFDVVGDDLVVPTSEISRVHSALRASWPLVHHEPAAETCGEATTSRGSDILAFEHSVAPAGVALYETDTACRIRLTDEPQQGDDAVDFPIDLVYTWVDGNDWNWQERRAATLGGQTPASFHPEAASRARYESFDELRYSLRSVERFAEFVRRVYIVTDSQCPEWLNTSHPGVRVIDHRSIFPDESYLPVFNSHAIEARLHHIPGLAEHYLYLNDDFLFGRRVTARDFFDPDGTAKVFVSTSAPPEGVPATDLKPVDVAAINVCNLVTREFGRTETRQKFKHVPYAQRKAVYEVIEKRFQPELERTARSRVRAIDDVAVASSLHQHVALVTGLGRLAMIDSGYVDLGQVHLRTRLDRLRRTPMPVAICLNDSDRDEMPRHRIAALMREFFEAVYPDKSSYER